MKKIVILSFVFLVVILLAGSIITKHSLKRDLDVPKDIDQSVCNEINGFEQRGKAIALRKRALYQGGDRQIFYTLKAVAYDFNLRFLWNEEEVNAALASICRT